MSCPNNRVSYNSQEEKVFIITGRNLPLRKCTVLSIIFTVISYNDVTVSPEEAFPKSVLTSFRLLVKVIN